MNTPEYFALDTSIQEMINLGMSAKSISDSIIAQSLLTNHIPIESAQVDTLDVDADAGEIIYNAGLRVQFKDIGGHFLIFVSTANRIVIEAPHGINGRHLGQLDKFLRDLVS